MRLQAERRLEVEGKGVEWEVSDGGVGSCDEGLEPQVPAVRGAVGSQVAGDSLPEKCQ